MSPHDGFDDAGFEGHWVKDRAHCHEAWLHWNVTDRCNLNCAYCFNHDDPAKKESRLAPLDIEALMRTLDAAGKIFKIRFTGGGEPFLVPNIIEACEAITERHYVGFNTNLTCGNVKEFAGRIDPERVANINVSVHIKELERHGLVDRVIGHYALCKERGFTIVASVVAHPSLAADAERYRDFFETKGMPINFSFFVGTYNGKEYPRSYTAEEIKLFRLNSIWIRRHYEYRGVCNAGFNVGIVLPDGTVAPCFATTRETLGNVYSRIRFRKNLLVCPLKRCNCPLLQFDPYLYKKALKENSGAVKKLALLADWPLFLISYTVKRGIGGLSRRLGNIRTRTL